MSVPSRSNKTFFKAMHYNLQRKCIACRRHPALSTLEIPTHLKSVTTATVERRPAQRRVELNRFRSYQGRTTLAKTITTSGGRSDRVKTWPRADPRSMTFGGTSLQTHLGRGEKHSARLTLRQIGARARARAIFVPGYRGGLGIPPNRIYLEFTGAVGYLVGPGRRHVRIVLRLKESTERTGACDPRSRSTPTFKVSILKPLRAAALLPSSLPCLPRTHARPRSRVTPACARRCASSRR